MRGAGEVCEQYLIRRRSKLERPAERRQDGAEGLQPLGPSAGRAPASTPTRSVDGRRCARLGLKCCTRTRPQCSSELPAARTGMPAAGPAVDRMVGQTEIFESLSHALPLIPRSRTQLWAFQNAQDHTLTQNWTREMTPARSKKLAPHRTSSRHTRMRVARVQVHATKR